MYPRKGAIFCANLLTGAPLATGLDGQSWEAVKRHAPAYGVGPALAYAPRSIARGADREWCDHTLITTAWRHQRMLLWLTGLLDAFDAAGVEPMPFNWPVLAERCHDLAFTRKPSTDLDIAVRPAHLDAANQVLLRLGYRLFAPGDVQRRYSHHVVHLHNEWPRVELHFRLSHGARGIPLRHQPRRFGHHSRSAKRSNPSPSQVSGLWMAIANAHE